MQFKIPAHLPFNFLSVVRSHGWMQLLPFRFDESSEELRYVLRLDDGQVIELGISDGGDGLLVNSIPLTAARQSEVSGRLTWMFNLDRDFSCFYDAIQREPALSHVKKRAMGRVLRCPTFFEDVVRTILTTNTLWAATRRMVANVVGQFGDPLPSDPGLCAFPTPQRLAASSETELRVQTRLGYRAPYILRLAQQVIAGNLDLEAFKTSHLTTPELRNELLKITGIGPYAAANLLMLLGRNDFIPIDSWALKMVSQEWHDGQPVTPAQVQADFEKWGEWKGLVYFCWDWAALHKDNGSLNP
jgi:3-methyladenine DNA glycosylase/8-oxoguanine DNA glycosylase